MNGFNDIVKFAKDHENSIVIVFSVLSMTLEQKFGKPITIEKLDFTLNKVFTKKGGDKQERRLIEE